MPAGAHVLRNRAAGISTSDLETIVISDDGENAFAPINLTDERWAFRTFLPEFPESKTSAPANIEAKPKPPTRITIGPPNIARLSGQFRDAIRIRLAIEVDYGTRFLLIPVFLLAGIATYFALPSEPRPHEIPLALAVLGLFTVLLRKHRAAVAVGLMFFLVTTGLGLAQFQTQRLSTQLLGSEVITHIRGLVLGAERRPDGSARYTLRVIRTYDPQLRYISDIVRVTDRKAPEALPIGQIVEGLAGLRPPSGPTQPGGFDFAFYSYFDGVAANGFFMGAPTYEAASAELALSDKMRIGFQRIRHAIADRINVHAGEGLAVEASVSAALVTGLVSAIPDEVDEALRISGLAHILSISGLHMALVAGTVMAFMRQAGALNMNATSRRPTKKIAAVAALGFVFLYLFIAGASIATQRSFIMLSIMLIAVLLERSALTKRNLAIAAIILLGMFPDQALGPGFQMSFAATLALIASYDIFTRRFTSAKGSHQIGREDASIYRRAFKFFLGLSATSIVAGLATGLFSAYHFHRVAWLGLPANLAAVPILTFITMPSGILGMMMMPFGLEGLFFHVMNVSVGWITDIASGIATLTGDPVSGKFPPAALAIASFGLIVLCIPRTGLRWFSLPLFGLALSLSQVSERPNFLVSEDASQVAYLGESALAVNRSRPNGFTIDNWRSAYKASELIKPEKITGDVQPHAGNFYCDADGNCKGEFATEAGLFRILYVRKVEDLPASEKEQCDFDFIIIAQLPTPSLCMNVRTLDATELALQGSAEIYAFTEDGRQAVRIKHSYASRTINADGEGRTRPWLAARRFSRAARNLASNQ